MTLTRAARDYRLMTMGTKTREIPAGRFKAECLALLDEVAMTGEVLVITKRGKAVAKVVRADETAPPPLRGSVLREERLVDPAGERWGADA